MAGRRRPALDQLSAVGRAPKRESVCGQRGDQPLISLLSAVLGAGQSCKHNVWLAAAGRGPGLVELSAVLGSAARRSDDTGSSYR